MALRAAASRLATRFSLPPNTLGVSSSSVSVAWRRPFSSSSSSSSSASASVQEEDNDEVIFEIDEDNFQEKIVLSDVPVIVDCYADWCGPCKTLAPILESAVRDAGGKVKLAKIDVDENPEISGGLNIQSLPTVFAVYQGTIFDQFIGMKPPEEIQAFVERVSNPPEHVSKD